MWWVMADNRDKWRSIALQRWTTKVSTGSVATHGRGRIRKRLLCQGGEGTAEGPQGTPTRCNSGNITGLVNRRCPRSGWRRGRRQRQGLQPILHARTVTETITRKTDIFSNHMRIIGGRYCNPNRTDDNARGGRFCLTTRA